MILRRLLGLITVFLFLFAYIVIPAGAVSIFQVKDRIISESAILIDGDTGQILFEKDMHKVLHPASITKVMTALLALENADLSDEIVVSRNALRGIEPDAASIHLRSTEEITLEQAMYAMAVVSAADASNVIAEHVGGTVNEFIKLMNERAKELGALNTNFVNSYGMPNNAHLTTAYDMALISMAAVNTPGFNEIFSASRYVIPPTNIRNTPRVLRSQNRMITGEFAYRDLISSKTGWTVKSQYTFFAAAKRDDRTLIGITIRSPLIDDKYKDLTRLFNYGFGGFDRVSFSIEELESFTLTDADGTKIAEDFTVNEEFSCLIPKALTKNDVNIEYIVESYPAENSDIDNESNDIENGNDDIESESSVVENELQVRVVFTLNVSSLWPGIHELGEVTAIARLIEKVDDDLPATMEEPMEPGPDGLDVSGSDRPGSVPGEQDGPASGSGEPETVDQVPAIDEPVNDIVYIDGDYILETSPVWIKVLRDAGILIALFIIVLCYIVIRIRQRKNGRNRNNKDYKRRE